MPSPKALDGLDTIVGSIESIVIDEGTKNIDSSLHSQYLLIYRSAPCGRSRFSRRLQLLKLAIVTLVAPDSLAETLDNIQSSWQWYREHGELLVRLELS